MAFIYTVNPDPPMTREVYDRIRARLTEAGQGNPPGLICHVCHGSEGDLRVTDIWETREDWERFSDTLRPILRELGGNPREPLASEVRAMNSGPLSTTPANDSNLETHRASHNAFNRRDLAEAVRLIRDDAVYVDHGRGLTMKGPEQFRDGLQEWVDAFSNATIADPHYVNGDNSTIARFHGRGTNDGTMNGRPASGHRVDLPVCEILHYDAGGRIVSGEMFFDSLSLLVQLGHLEAPTAG
jgi:steroid delta-isomerase-like uncharacterized protein